MDWGRNCTFWNNCYIYILNCLKKNISVTKTTKILLSHYNPNLSVCVIYLEAQFQLFFRPWLWTWVSVTIATAFSNPVTASGSLIPDQWRVGLLLRQYGFAAVPRYKHKDFPFICPSKHLQPIKAQNWGCPVNGIWFLMAREILFLWVSQILLD